MIVLEFPNISPAFKKDLFMTDRERILDKAPKKEIIKNLKAYLENSDKIKRFKEQRTEESLKNSLSSGSTELKELMDKRASNNPTIIKGLMDGNLLLGNVSTTNIAGTDIGTSGTGRTGGGGGTNIPPQLKDEPTFFEPRSKNSVGGLKKKVQQNASFKISFTTDAPINYFERLVNPAILAIHLDGKI